MPTEIPLYMQAMVLEKPGEPLVLRQAKVPSPGPRQVLIKVTACGVCRTDLHVLDGELPKPKLPLILGHEIVGMVVCAGEGVTLVKEGEAVGVPWLGYTCGKCKYCLQKKENLCENALFTGYTLDGGYAEFTVVDERYCFPLETLVATPASAPLLCAGLIGYRSYGMIGEGVSTLGLYGFGAAAHILIQVALFQGLKIYAFTRDEDTAAQQFALKLGATWAGNSSDPAPVKLDAAIIFAPAGPLVPKALADVDKGGVVVCGGIHMSDIPAFPYRLLWEERVVRSVANLTRQDGIDFLTLAPRVGIKTETRPYPLAQANQALEDLRNGKLQGAAVLVM
ncbi:alcohol dehydrogenase [Rufibacter radiotolerans]|uniref:Alcohol dehydrogenase n=1 Tax=Rufibacter radiotolerans TaxID=1379910 RepID=A0A0H4VQJ3_9BACT|nr:zinc-dependent alcohol dehydrogenase family protein [Rufibacter radiotolerans]AKQ47588.1 alcohol dehydrogenase [Rufibacter radiotolerans]